jgi:hypothetical protein
MAIPIALIVNGLPLLTLILKKIWSAEETPKTGDEKREYVRRFVKEALFEYGVEVENIDELINDLVYVLNKHKIFTTKGDE